LIDTNTLEPISGSLVKLFYIDIASSTKVYLGLEVFTDLEGKINFLVNMPVVYADPSIIFIAEADQTTSHQGASNSFELFITESPTSIDFATLTDSYQFYINESLDITFELYDYFENLLITETLYLEIETPTNYLTLVISCNQTITLNFTELGLYRVNASYEGSSLYLPTYTQIFYGVSPIPTSLEFTEEIPEVLYSDEHLFLRAKLENNITETPIAGKSVKFYIANDTSTYLIYGGITDNEGLISYIWDVNSSFIDQNVKVFAIYDYIFYYENSSTDRIPFFISRYSVILSLIEFPELISPFVENNFIIQANREQSGEIAQNCHLQIFMLLPNGSQILLKDGFTDNTGFLEFNWTPYQDIFKFSEVNFEIYIIEDNFYYGGLISTNLVSVEKLQTIISIIPEKIHVLPDDIISIQFDLVDTFGKQLTGQVVLVEINNPLFSTDFIIVIGVNDTYFFTIPHYGPFEISASFEGDERNYPSSEISLIYSEKFDLEIALSILESFSSIESSGFLGTYLNYSILDFNNHLTLVANVTIKEYNVPWEGAYVSFYFLQKNKEPILIGSNFTDEEGIAKFYWDTSNYSTPNWWKYSAILAKIDETEKNNAAESNPIYFNLRKIRTSLAIGLFTSEFRININYAINITLYDEFLIKLKGYNISVDIYFKGKIIQSYELITNETTHINFTASKLGNYIIEVYFVGTEAYKESYITEKHKCIEKEPTNINIWLPDYITPGKLYSIKIILFNSTGGLLIGELVEVKIMYHDDSGATEYIDLEVIIGENSTFEWIFPEYDEYVFKATYSGNDEHLGCKVNSKAKSIYVFSLSFWEITLLLLIPSLMITPSFKIKSSKWKRRKKIFMVMFLIITILFSSYAGIAYLCSQIERTGLIKDLKGVSNYNQENPLLQQQQDTINDLYDYGASTLENVNPEWIPDLEDESEPYDLVEENSSVIPPELDTNPPELWFSGLSNGDNLLGTTPIRVVAFDRESGIQNILFKLYYRGINLVKEGVFEYNPSSDLYIYNLSTTDYDDGEYVIYAFAFDNNNNNETVSVEIKILNNPVYDVSETEFENVLVELTDSVNVSFISIANGSFNLKIIDIDYKTIIKISGPITAEEVNTLEIPIDPLLFKAGNYEIVITILMTDGLIFAYETQELNLEVLKESIKLELDIEEGTDIYSNHFINFRARLIENDAYLSESGKLIEEKPEKPIPGQILTFEISDTDNPEILGTVVTDIGGYATFNYFVSLAKGQHMFNVTFQGNNIYQPLERLKLFENKGKYMNIQLQYVNTTVPYNEIGTITAVLLADENRISNETLYFNITNSENNYYLGMGTTDTNGEVTISFPCDYSPDKYSVIVSYDGKSIYADNVSIFEDRLEIIKQDVDLSIETGMGSDIYCPYYYNTTLVAKLLEKDTDVGIEGIELIFEVVKQFDGPPYPIGTSTTDSYGLASLDLNPSMIDGLIPDLDQEYYFLNVNTTGNEFYNGKSVIANLNISKDIPIISIQGTETLFYTEFQLNASLTDSQLNPIEGEYLIFDILDSSTGISLHQDTTSTDVNGMASLIVLPEDFPYVGIFDIFVFYGGSSIYNSTSSMVKHGLQINYHTTQLFIQGPEKGNVIDPYEIELILIDSQGIPITGQEILIECYKEGGITNILKPNTYVITDVQGNATFSININIPGRFVIKAFYLPLSDDNEDNNGFLSSQNELTFLIERVPAELSVTKMNLPRIMRGDLFEFTIEAGLEEAKREDIPINIYIDIDLNGDGVKHDDIFGGKYRFIENGTGVISYQIPTDDTFQAGQYMFTIIIDEKWSSFTGSTSFQIDFVERTTLEIIRHINNTRANGKHYLWEQEKIEFILRDEDRDPLPDNCTIIDGTVIGINRLINYQIVNGENIYGTTEVDLQYGNYSRDHTPTTFGFETCTVMYGGARFFAPSDSRKTVQILRRPLILTFINYSHNNPNRASLPYSGHRGEDITIVARVQDYLNESYLQNQIVQFGHSGNFFGVSNRSDNNGWIYLNVELNSTNNLIQAGNYRLNLKIAMNDYYQSIVATHSDELHIFEIGLVWIYVGVVSMEDMNYVVRPTIFLFDEDFQVVRNIPFYIELVDITTNKVAHKQYMTSGRVEIPIMDGGIYQIRVSIADHIISQSLDIQEIASYFSQHLYLFLLTKSEAIVVIDGFLPSIYIPFLSDVLYYALEFAVKWEADIWTFLLLLVINIFSGPLGQQISFTWTGFLKIVLFSVFCGIFGPIRKLYYKFLDKIGIIPGTRLVLTILKSPNWFNLGIALVIGGMGILHAITGSNRTKPDLSFSISTLLLELGILALAGFVEYIFHNAQGILGLLGGAFATLAEMLWKSVYKYDPLKETLPLVQLLILIITDTLIGLVIDMIFSLIPPVSGFLGFLIDLARNILKISLVLIVNIVINVYIGAPTGIVGEIIKRIVGEVVKQVLTNLVINLLFTIPPIKAIFGAFL